MLSKEEIEDSIENKVNNDELFSIQEIKYLLNYHINTTFYNDTVIEVLNKSSLQYIEQLETKEQKLIEKLEKDIVNITKTLQDGKHSDDYSRCRLKAYRTKTKEILSMMKGGYMQKQCNKCGSTEKLWKEKNGEALCEKCLIKEIEGEE